MSFSILSLPGYDLFSRILADQLSSALERFTYLFGMARFAKLLQRGEKAVVPLRFNNRKGSRLKH